MVRTQPALSQPAPRSGTRQRILDVALRLFGERGYAATSVRDIADELGITKAAVHYHFPAKDQMVAALLRPVLEALDAAVDAALADGSAEPRRLLGEVQRAWLRAGPMMQVLITDPSVVEVAPLKTQVDATSDRVVAALAGSRAGPVRLVRGHCAMGALFGGMAGLGTGHCGPGPGPAGDPPLPPPTAPTRAQLDAVLDAAVAALGRPPTRPPRPPRAQGPTLRAGRPRRAAT